MRRNKIFIFTFFLFFWGCVTTNQPKVDEVTMLRRQIDSLNLEIYEMKEQIDYMRDELQFKESEISYWGHKYDSCMEVLNVRK